MYSKIYSNYVHMSKTIIDKSFHAAYFVHMHNMAHI